jgi:threonine synthase
VGNPSNFARLMDLYDNSLEKIRQEVVGYHFNDEETRQFMREVYQQHGYTLDPHGAIGYGALRDYLKDKPELTGVFLETAHPAKFIDVVEETIPAKVTIPANLQQAMAKEKTSVPMAADYEALKKFLISRA